MIRHANAFWQGSGKEGHGHISLESGAMKEVDYSYNKRFGNEPGTNPEELVGAAHASCFTMKCSFTLGAAGFTPESLETKCYITLDNGAITKSHLVLKAKVPGISKEVFEECANDAKLNCPMSKLLSCEITLDATLE
jgi:lipoyl-dependent peroxiredoxin